MIGRKKLWSAAKKAGQSFWKLPVGFPVGFMKTWQAVALVLIWTSGALLIWPWRFIAWLWQVIRR